MFYFIHTRLNYSYGVGFANFPRYLLSVDTIYMNSFLRLLYCAIVLGLSGCQGLHHDATKRHYLEQCKLACTQHFEFCRQNCIDSCPNCSASSQMKAAENYRKYVHERSVEGKKVMRELNSYRDPLQCRKVTCDCLSDFAICKQGCAGVIPKKLQAVPYCV